MGEDVGCFAILTAARLCIINGLIENYSSPCATKIPTKCDKRFNHHCKAAENRQQLTVLFLVCLFVVVVFFMHYLWKKSACFQSSYRGLLPHGHLRKIIVMQVLSWFTLFYSLLQSLYCSSVYSAVRIICFHKKPKKDNRKIMERFNSPLHNARIHFVPTV